MSLIVNWALRSGMIGVCCAVVSCASSDGAMPDSGYVPVAPLPADCASIPSTLMATDAERDELFGFLTSGPIQTGSFGYVAAAVSGASKRGRTSSPRSMRETGLCMPTADGRVRFFLAIKP